MKVKMDMPKIPESYEYTGDYRRAVPGDIFLDDELGPVLQMPASGYTTCRYPILRKKKITRPPVPGDIKSSPIPCRSSHDGFEWVDGYLGAVMPWRERPYCVHETRTHAVHNPHMFTTYTYCVIEVDE